ncbi:MAG TPA: hypothetical protein VNT53_01545 [Pseudolysinimonas sp.]|nr:hypothetical protein [Pseudolysinimonas sp.]
MRAGRLAAAPCARGTAGFRAAAVFLGVAGFRGVAALRGVAVFRGAAGCDVGSVAGFDSESVALAGFWPIVGRAIGE